MVENEKKIKRDTKIMATKCAKQYVYLNRPELIKYEKKKKKDEKLEYRHTNINNKKVKREKIDSKSNCSFI